MTESKRTDFFIVNHGADNVEEWIDLSRVYFINFGIKYNPEKKHYAEIEKLQAELKHGDAYFDYNAIFHFENGTQVKISLTGRGYEDLRNRIKKMSDHNERE